MSEESFRQYVTNRVKVKMKAFDPEFMIEYPNQPFDRPENQVYGRFFIINGGSVNAGKSGDKIIIRRTGLIQLTVLTPATQGTQRATRIIDAMSKAFENHQGRADDGHVITFNTTQTRYFEPMSGWHPSIFRIGYARDELCEISSAN